MRFILVAWMLVSLGGCQTTGARVKGNPKPDLGQSHPLTGRIWSVAERTFLTEQALVERLRRQQVVLLGEKHDNGDHHRVQARLLQGLVTGGQRPAVVWEMLTAAEQEALDRHLRRDPLDAAGLGAAVRWNARGWPDWRLYQPIAEVALQARLPLVAAGVDRSALMRLFHASPTSAPTSQPAALKLPPLPPAALASLARAIKASHCGHASPRMLELMIRAQVHRDTVMARQLVAAGARQGAAVLIAGGEHVRQDRGAPYFVRALASAKRVPAPRAASVALLEVLHQQEDPAAYAPAEPGLRPPFDYLWFTWRVDNDDPCATFRQQLRRMRRKDQRHHDSATGGRGSGK